MVNVAIHNDLLDSNNNIIIYNQQKIVGLNLQDGTMNIEDLFQLTVDDNFFLFLPELIQAEQNTLFVRKLAVMTKPLFNLNFLIHCCLLVQQTTIKMVVSYYVQMGE